MTKKIAFAFLLGIAISMNANAQNKKAAVKPPTPVAETKPSKPTKEETMDWIAGKMKEYMIPKREFVSYKDGVFIFKIEYGFNKNICTNIIDLNKITGISDEYSSNFFVSGKKLIKADCTGQSFDTDADNWSIGGPNYDKYPYYFDFKSDSNLLERLRKAFLNLIEYNSSKKGADEKF